MSNEAISALLIAAVVVAAATAIVVTWAVVTRNRAYRDYLERKRSFDDRKRRIDAELDAEGRRTMGR